MNWNRVIFPSLHDRKEGWPSDQENAAKPPWTSRRLLRWLCKICYGAATPPYGYARRGILRDSSSLIVLLILFFVTTTSAQPASVQSVVMSPKFQSAEDFISKDHDRFVREVIQLTEIEAPPFKEAKRGAVFAEMLRQNGLSDVETDAEGKDRKSTR